MKKLKCWKKIGNDSINPNLYIWNKTLPKTKTRISVEKYLGKWEVYAYKESSTHRGQVFQKNLINTKPQALKFAESYMKNHDTC